MVFYFHAVYDFFVSVLNSVLFDSAYCYIFMTCYTYFDLGLYSAMKIPNSTFILQKEMELKMLQQQLNVCKTKAQTVKDKIVEVCSNPSIYESELKQAEEKYRKAKKLHSSLYGLSHSYDRFAERVFLFKHVWACPQGLKKFLSVKPHFPLYYNCYS